ncbi:MAG TPA: hypothetical protein VHZ06_00415 [Marmoricola sp.]|jgi:hypothetical protein|nr:hypothetical protein [Marmoricola sp.]
MSEDQPEPGSQPPTSLVDLPGGFGVVLAVRLGILLAFVGLVDGIVVVSKRHVVDCSASTIVNSSNGNPKCFVHPHLANGIAIAVISVMLGILIWLCGFLGKTVVRDRPVPEG